MTSGVGLTETSAVAPVRGIGCNVAGRIAPVASTLTEQAPNCRHHPKVDQDGGLERDHARSSSQGFDQCRAPRDRLTDETAILAHDPAQVLRSNGPRGPWRCCRNPSGRRNCRNNARIRAKELKPPVHGCACLAAAQSQAAQGGSACAERSNSTPWSSAANRAVDRWLGLWQA